MYSKYLELMSRGTYNYVFQCKSVCVCVCVREEEKEKVERRWKVEHNGEGDLLNCWI